MTANNSKNYDYYFGGSLPLESKTYVKRQADDLLLQNLRNAKFSYVLNSRQMGKSSLMVRTKKRLEEDGIVCAAIDLTDVGSQNITVTQWYRGVVKQIVDGLELEIDWKKWWNQKEDEGISTVQMFGDFIREVLLPEVASKDGQVVIFLDEIDSIINLDFGTDDFFAFIRACHNKRAEFPLYKCLTFCLLGVATPSDLIADKKRTPFNIGEAIELTGFTFKEAEEALILGLREKVDDPEVVLNEVLDWTGGQPFLTQKLCHIIVKYAESREANVSQLVQTYIIEGWESQDNPEHLRTISDRIFSKNRGIGRQLALYNKILVWGKVKANKSVEQMDLRLSGLVVKRQGLLIVYNQIYEAVFNESWVSQELENLEIGVKKKEEKIEELKLELAMAQSELSQLKKIPNKTTQSYYKWAAILVFGLMTSRFLIAPINAFREEFLQPQIASYLNQAGTDNYNQGKYESAEFYYRLALTVDSDFGKARYGLAVVCETREDFDCALKQYNLARQDNNFRVIGRAINNQARLYVFQEQKYEIAIGRLLEGLKQAERKAIELEIKADLHKNLGWAYLLQNRYEEAEENLIEAIALHEENTPAYCLLAQLYELQGKKTEALQQWKNCLRYPAPPQNPEVDTWKNMAKQRFRASEN